MSPAKPVLGFPEKFELALRFGQGPIGEHAELSDSDRLLLEALSQQAIVGPCNEPRPSLFDTAAAKARWQAWKDLGNRSKMEAMYMYTQAVEELAPDWWKWPPLGLVDGADKEEEAAAEPDLGPAPLQLSPNGQPPGGWSKLPDIGGGSQDQSPGTSRPCRCSA